MLIDRSRELLFSFIFKMMDKMEAGSFADGKYGIKRHLLGSSTPSSNGKLFNFKGCVFLYASSIDFAVGNAKVSMLNASYTLSGHCASNETSYVLGIYNFVNFFICI